MDGLERIFTFLKDRTYLTLKTNFPKEFGQSPNNDKVFSVIYHSLDWSDINSI